MSSDSKKINEVLNSYDITENESIQVQKVKNEKKYRNLNSIH